MTALRLRTIVATWLEFHDATLLTVTAMTGDSLRMVLRAYIHRWNFEGDRWQGTGWRQLVHITIGTDQRVLVPALPADVVSGRLSVGPITHDNLVRLPLDASDPVTLRLNFVGQDALDMVGHSVRVEPFGEPTYIEDLPADLRPDA